MTSRTRSKYIIYSVLGILLGVLLMVFGRVDYKAKHSTPRTYEYLTPDDLEPGLAITGTIHGNYGALLESYTTQNGSRVGLTWYYYLIDFGEYGYIAYKTLPSTELDAQSEEYYNYLTKASYAQPRAITIHGAIKKATKAERQMTISALQQMGFSAQEAEQYCYPYVIDADTNNSLAFMYPAGIIVIIAFVGLIIFLIIYGIVKKDAPDIPAYQDTSSPLQTPNSVPSGQTFTPYEPSQYPSMSDFEKSISDDPSSSYDSDYTSKSGLYDSDSSDYDDEEDYEDTEDSSDDETPSSSGKFSLRLDD